MWVFYTLYSSGFWRSFNKSGAQVVDPANITNKERQQMQLTKKRMENYVNYFTDTQQTLETLQASSSINIVNDLKLREFFLEKFTP